jgi:MFS family permease
MSKREKYLGFAGSACGVGQLLGPILGGILNSLLGYMPNYMIFAILLSFQAVANYILIPDSLNNKPEISQKEFSKKIIVVEKQQDVRFSWFLRNRRCLFALISCTMMSYFSQFI